MTEEDTEEIPEATVTEDHPEVTTPEAVPNGPTPSNAPPNVPPPNGPPPNGPRVPTGEDRARAEMSLIASGGVMSGMIALAPLCMMMAIPSFGSEGLHILYGSIGVVLSVPWAICTSIVWVPLAIVTYKYATR